MTPATSIVFSSFLSAADPMPRAWVRFRQQLLAGDESASGTLDASENGRVSVWRLIASNNRELGRSSRLYGSFEQARDDAIAVRGSAERLRIDSVHGPTAGTHGWFASFDEQLPVMTCGRWYGALGSSVEAAHQSIEALTCAVVNDSGHRLLWPDRRRSVHERVSESSPH
ncbi:hypothetical protein [Agreia sp. COWG]|uniref:hypothetical protein n=1 Tax=Agreia sp. COWG TaxID=2773266 RepID=UPI001927E605|nr:hypothetical protein [Agreia sp. COWG]CAD5998187.1 conserved protein of unknown function [Agreia sp. COWG]